MTTFDLYSAKAKSIGLTLRALSKGFEIRTAAFALVFNCRNLREVGIWLAGAEFAAP